MAQCINRDAALRFLQKLEHAGIDLIYWNNAPLSLAEARLHLGAVTRVYLHRGLLYAPSLEWRGYPGYARDGTEQAS